MAYKSHSHHITNRFKAMGSSPNSNAKSSTGQKKQAQNKACLRRCPPAVFKPLVPLVQVICSLMRVSIPVPHLLQLNLLRLLFTFAPWIHLRSFLCPSAAYCLPTSLLFPSESRETSKLEVEKTEVVDYTMTARPFSSLQSFCWYPRLQSTACKTIPDYELVFILDFP